jgi:hypothetical protein
MCRLSCTAEKTPKHHSSVSLRFDLKGLVGDSTGTLAKMVTLMGLVSRLND